MGFDSSHSTLTKPQPAQRLIRCHAGDEGSRVRRNPRPRLYLYDRQKQRWTIVADGLPSTNVTALSEGNGYIYIGTDNGLVRVQENKLQP
jgi:hypothetical protein